MLLSSFLVRYVGGSLITLPWLAMLFATGAMAADTPTLNELAAPCLACHSLDSDNHTHVGPSLAGIAGRPIGADRNYTYSEAFTRKASYGEVWDRESLDEFLQDPEVFIAGTAMSYPGLPEARDRAILLDWLLSDPSGRVADLVDANYSGDPAVKAVLDMPADAEYGEYLAGECLGCHQAGSDAGGVPPIHKLTPDYFVFALLEYQNGARSNRVMQTVTGALGAEEMAALIAVFSQSALEE
ncbi:MAG: hypothetical protein AB8B97_18855 [Granulosicoccus sp.]